MMETSYERLDADELDELRDRMAVPFVLVGRGSTAQVAARGSVPLVVDAFGARCPDGSAWTWQPPDLYGPARAVHWATAQRAASAHGALIVWADGSQEEVEDGDDPDEEACTDAARM